MLTFKTDVTILLGTVFVDKSANIKYMLIQFTTDKTTHKMSLLNVGIHTKLFNALNDKLNQKTNHKMPNGDIVIPQTELFFRQR